MTDSNNSVVITDIDIPFTSIVILGIKWMLACIPAVIIFYIIMVFFIGTVGVVGFGISSIFL